MWKGGVLDEQLLHGGMRKKDETLMFWAIDPSLAHDSDHNTIKFTIDHGLKEIENMLGIKYCLNNVDPADWINNFEQELNKASQELDPLFDNNNLSDDQLDEYAAALSSTIQNATALSGKERVLSANAKPWWDPELSSAAKNVTNARLAHQSYQHLTLAGEYSPPLQTNIILNRNFFKRLCNFKKKAWVTDALENTTANDIWNFPKWSKGIPPSSTSPPKRSKMPYLKTAQTPHQATPRYPTGYSNGHGVAH